MNKQVTIEDLYTDKATLEVKFKEKDLAFDVEMIYYPSFFGKELKPDCKVGHFGYNKFFRTDKGANGEKYASLQALKGAITRTAKRKGLTAPEFIFKLK